jgi:hypothetical protein
MVPVAATAVDQDVPPAPRSAPVSTLTDPDRLCERRDYLGRVLSPAMPVPSRGSPTVVSRPRIPHHFCHDGRHRQNCPLTGRRTQTLRMRPAGDRSVRTRFHLHPTHAVSPEISRKGTSWQGPSNCRQSLFIEHTYETAELSELERLASCRPYLVRRSVVVACPERAASGVYIRALRSPPVRVGSGCQGWSVLKRFGSSVAQPRPESKHHGGCTEEDGGEPDLEVAERQGDDAGGQQHYYPGHMVSGCQLGPEPTVAPTVSVLGEPLELRWIIHPDRHLTACGTQTVLAVMLAGGRSGRVLAHLLEVCPHRPGRAAQRYTSRRLGV